LPTMALGIFSGDDMASPSDRIGIGSLAAMLNSAEPH
jgi:hypothetical protein